MYISTSQHHYSQRALLADLARASTGLILTLGPLFLGDLLIFLQITLVLFGLIFFVFGLRSLARRAVTVELCHKGIRASGPFDRSINWEELKDLRLLYFSTRRDREKGWMQLRLTTDKTRICLDDCIEGFDHIVCTTVQAAKEHNVKFDLATLENISALGIENVVLREAEHGK